MTTKKIKGTDEAWDTGALGATEQYAKPLSASDTKQDLEAINAHLGLQPISIRLEKSLIDDFKAIADLNGIGYQTLMRQALKRFASCEMKAIVRAAASEAKRATAKKAA